MEYMNTTRFETRGLEGRFSRIVDVIIRAQTNTQCVSCS